MRRVVCRSIVATAVATVLAAGIAACGSSGDESGASGDAYLIGSNLDRSGPLAYEGAPMTGAARAYFTELNSSGGINGHPVKYVPLDNGSDTARGIANVKNLAQDGAVAILGFGSSVMVDATLPEIDRNKVVSFVQATSPASLEDPWAYSTAAYMAAQAEPMVAFAEGLIDNPKPRVAIFSQESAVLEAWRQSMVDVLEEKGWQVVADETVSLASTDVGPQVSAIARAEPDLVFETMSGSKAPLVVNGLRSLNYNGPIIAHTGAADVPSLKSLNDPDYYVVRDFAFPADDSPGVKEMNATLRDADMNPAKPWVVNGYVQAMIVSEGLKECGWPCTPEDLQEALNGMTLDTDGVTFGPIQYTPTDHTGFSKLRVYRWNPEQSTTEAVGDDVPYSP